MTVNAVTVTDDIAGLWDELLAVRAEKKRLDDAETLIRQAIRETVGDNQIAVHNGHPIFRVAVQTSRRLDSRALKDAEPDVYERYCKPSESYVIRAVKEGVDE